MHQHIRKFCRDIAEHIGGNVLEVGSRNVNGSIRDTLPITIGVDMEGGAGVDQIVDVVNLIDTFGPESFDCVVSCDALEHMKDWDESLRNMWGVLKTKGVLVLTMASVTKGLHGYPNDYHRMPLEDMIRMFDGNTVLGSFDVGPSQGVCVIKTVGIDFTVRPRPVRVLL